MNSSDMCNSNLNGGGASSNGEREDSCSSSSGARSGGSGLPPPKTAVSPEMLYKLSKKIAQLTKVIYSLNTRNDDLSLDMESMRSGFEERIQEAQEEIQRLLEERRSSNPPAVNGDSHSTDSELLSSNESLKKELTKARNNLKNMETKMAEREEENRQMIESLNSSILPNGDPPHSLTNGNSKKTEDALSDKVSQLSKEKAELIRTLDRRDVKIESLRIETESLHNEVKGLNESLSSLNLELSAARVELSYREKAVPGREDSEFTEELIRRIEELTRDKEQMMSKLEETHLIQVQQRAQIEDQKAVIGELEGTLEGERQRNRELNEEILCLQTPPSPSQEVDPAEIVERVTKELQTQHETTLLDSKKFYEKEIKDLKESLESSQRMSSELKVSLEEVSSAIAEREKEIESLGCKVSSIQSESEVALEKMRESTLEDCQKEIEETKRRADERIKEIQSNMEIRIEELQDNIGVMTSQREDLKVRLLESEGCVQRKEREYQEKITQLEEALEQALTEREEILLAAGDEIQNEKDIALAIEQRLMDDFEWKLREIEREHRHKLEELKTEAEAQIKRANDSYNRSKDESFTKMSIELHRNMEEKLKAERLSLKSSYDEQGLRDKESVYARAKVDFEREKRALETSFSEERTKLEREIRALKRRVDDFPNEISRATSAAKKETENIEREGSVRLALLQEQNQKEIHELRKEHESHLNQSKMELQRKINDLESRLRASDGHRLDSIFKVREDVEGEFAERMEALREMYMGEVEKETKKVEELQSKLSDCEAKYRELTAKQAGEIEELNSYIALREEEHETKVNELLTRLQEQTTLAVRLQEEIDEYDWYIEDEEGNITERNPNSERPPSSASLLRGSGGSRPSSTRPFDSRARGGSTLSLNNASRPATEAESPPLRTSAAVLATEEFLEEEYLCDDEENQDEEEEATETEEETPVAPNSNTARELPAASALSKTSSASSVSYSSVTSEALCSPSSSKPDRPANPSPSIPSPTKKHGKRSHCAQQ